MCPSTLQSVNNNPQEWWVEVWNPILGITGCNDLHIAQNGGDTSRASCNYQHNNNGEVIVDSQVEAAGTHACCKSSLCVALVLVTLRVPNIFAAHWFMVYTVCVCKHAHVCVHVCAFMCSCVCKRQAP